MIFRPEGSTSSILSPTRSLALNSSALSPTASGTPRDSYSPGGLGLHRLSNSRSSIDTSRSFADCRPVLAPHQTMSYLSNPVYGGSSPFSHTSRPPSDETPSFHAVVDFGQLKLEDGTVVKPEILCKIEKGFFQSADGNWTCYRRNYFSVVLQYSLGGTYPQAPLYLTKSEGRSSSSRQERTMTEQVQALGVCLSAAVDGPNGKVVELIQHTPKRDKGPQSPVRVAKILPTPAARVPRQNSDLHGYSTGNYGVSPATSNVVQDPPLLPMQSAPDSTSSDVVGLHPPCLTQPPSSDSNMSQPTATAHTFERIQFKNATANNGKRRAQQQYYHLKAELWADIRQDPSRVPVWVKVAHRVSNPVVVRGRSPSHYKNEGPTSQSRGSSSSGIGSRPTSQWTALRSIVPPGGPTPSPYSSYGNASYQPPTYTAGSYLSRFHSTNHDGASYSMSSAADQSVSAQYLMALSDSSPMGGSRGLMNSPSGGTMMSNTGQERVADEESGSSGYAYYPGPLIEAGLANPKLAVKKEDSVRQQESSSGQLQNNGRMVGLETSRGIYSWGGNQMGP